MSAGHGRSAEAVDRRARDRQWQVSQERHDARDVEPLLGLGKRTAGHEVLDFLRLHADLLDQPAHDLRYHVVRADALTAPLLASIRRNRRSQSGS